MKITKKTLRVIPFFGLTDRKAEISYDLVKSGTELTLIILNLGGNKAVLNLTANIRHSAPNTKSRLSVRSALYDCACVNFNGNILIENAAVNSDTYLAHNTLLMSETASANTVPALVIKNKDVHAGHNATIGEVDRDMLFYMQSRGISKVDAEKLLVLAFFESQINLISDPLTQNKLIKQIEKCLIR
jgi:Fe-S cluster assembly protein SufD